MDDGEGEGESESEIEMRGRQGFYIKYHVLDSTFPVSRLLNE